MCDATAVSNLESGVVTTPSTCANCLARDVMDIVHNRCVFTDKQLIKLQETPDAIPDGDTPHTLTLVVYDALVN